MDPQQRLLLECTAEALLAARPPAAELAGAGVFVGEFGSAWGYAPAGTGFCHRGRGLLL